MAKALIYNEADAAFRHAIYQLIVTRGHVPKSRELAAALSRSEKTVRSALQRLARLHILVLQQNTSQILRAAPFWAVPTAFHVQSGKHAWWASCIWDALAIPAMLGRDARILTACACCDSAIELAVRKGRLLRAPGVIHFAVPASRWYEDIVFT
jgi:DNA-binding transcriptional MocR family regulator